MTATLGGIVTSQTVAAACTVAQVEAVGSVLATITVPNKATILDVIVTTTDMDTGGTTLTIDVGDASGPATPDDDRFIAAFAGSAVLSERMSDTDGSPVYTYRNLKGTDDSQVAQEIEATVKAAATTGAVGTFTLTVIYTNSV